MGRTPIIDAIVEGIIETLDLDKEFINKTKAIMEMVSFVEENGDDVILIQIGDNIEIKITR